MYLKKNLGVGINVDYTDTRFSNFAIKCLCKNEKVHETVFTCSYGAQIESVRQKKNFDSLVTLPFNNVLNIFQDLLGKLILLQYTVALHNGGSPLLVTRLL